MALVIYELYRVFDAQTTYNASGVGVYRVRSKLLLFPSWFINYFDDKG